MTFTEEADEVVASELSSSEGRSAPCRRARAPPIPSALLALPRPVVAAAMRQQERGEQARRSLSSAAASGAATPHTGSSTHAAVERQIRQAKRHWLEQNTLLEHRAALLAKAPFPQPLLAEHDLAELLAPMLAEVEELARRRYEEAAELSASRSRAAHLTCMLRTLIAHVGAGGAYLADLRAALEGADAEIAATKARHALSLEQLGSAEREASQDLANFSRRLEAWANEDTAPGRTATDGHAATTVAPRARVGGASSVAKTTSDAEADACVNLGEAPTANCDDAAIRAELARVDELLSGGADCGWDADEHAAYMRLRTRCLGANPVRSHEVSSATDSPRHKAAASSAGSRLLDGADADSGAGLARVNQLFDRAVRELPGKDLDAVRAHEGAVARREAALLRRREIVQSWRDKRKQEASMAQAAAEAETAVAEAARHARGVAQRNSRQVAEEERQKQLETWRELKLAEHAEKANAAARTDAEARLKEAREAERRAHVKDTLAARATQRAAEQAALRMLKDRQQREDAARKVQEHQVAMLTMQQRDAEAIERKKHAAAVRAAAITRREERLRQMLEAARPRVAKLVTRDTERLTRPTRAANARKEEGEKMRAELQGSSNAGPPPRFGASSITFAAAGSRAVPGWRSGL
jgi:hypothetical protein